MIGKQIGRYKVVEKIGEGGMAVVYKAEDLDLNRFVALKFLKAQLMGEADEKARFLHEARAAATLDHPNICTVFEVREAEGTTFLTMPYIDGPTLGQKIEAGRLGLGEIVEIGLQVARGLQAAHGEAIVHRDIKSSNIMLTSKGHAKIMDFGLAKSWKSSAITKRGTMVGTLAFMSPEQARGEVVDLRSDIWSFGVVLYHMITGALPFDGNYDHAVMYAVVNEDPAPLAKKRPGVPSKLDRVVKRAMAKDREKRFQSMDEVIKELESIQADLENSEGGAGAVKAGRRKRHLAYDVLAVALLVIAIGAVYYWQRNGAPNIVRNVLDLNQGAGTRQIGELSIAVLPFVNMSPEKENEYLSDGMSEEIINALSQIEGVRVASRTSTFALRGKGRDIREIGKDLHVEAVLEGSVRKGANTIRVTAQLINVRDGYHLWSGKYDSEIKDMLSIQDTISHAIVDALTGNLIEAQSKKPVKRHTANVEAFDLYLKGRYFWKKRSAAGLEKAIGYFREAIEKDSTYALAYAGLADSYLLLAGYLYLPPKAAYPKARWAAMRALAMDSTQAEAHTSLGSVQFLHEWNFPSAEKSYRTAIRLDPNYATAHHWYADFLAAMGRMGEALDQINLANRLEPFDVSISTALGRHHYWNRQYDAAIEQYRGSLELEPDHIITHALLGVAYFKKSKFTEGIQEFEKAMELSGGFPTMTAGTAWAYASARQEEEARRLLQELLALGSKRYVSPFYVGMIYEALGQREEALEWLERGFEERSDWLVRLRVDPIFDSLRPDPRFKALERRVGLI